MSFKHLLIALPFLGVLAIYIVLLALYYGLKLAWMGLGVLYSKYIADDEQASANESMG